MTCSPWLTTGPRPSLGRGRGTLTSVPVGGFVEHQHGIIHLKYSLPWRTHQTAGLPRPTPLLPMPAFPLSLFPVQGTTFHLRPHWTPSHPLVKSPDSQWINQPTFIKLQIGARHFPHHPNTSCRGKSQLCKEMGSERESCLNKVTQQVLEGGGGTGPVLEEKIWEQD